MRIEDYGLIGDMHAAALVGRDGAVDWLCLPRFDSPSRFAALLGDQTHGRWLLAPAGEVRASSRHYRPRSACPRDGLRDCGWDGARDRLHATAAQGPPRLMRIVEGNAGEVPMRMGAVAAPRLGVDHAVG